MNLHVQFGSLSWRGASGGQHDLILVQLSLGSLVVRTEFVILLVNRDFESNEIISAVMYSCY
jgi:hypothetical protein